MTLNKELVKKKIAALLAKTTDNGATEPEAAMALKKAQELMTTYMIDRGEVDIRETICSERETPVYPVGYKLGFLMNPISDLFDCITWKEKKNGQRMIVFFGFDDDTALCVYFYNFLCETIMSEAQVYKTTPDYKKLITHQHGKRVVASFIRGIQFRLIERIKDEVARKKETIVISNARDLALVKETVVSDAFDALNIKLYSRSSRAVYSDKTAYEAGIKRGDTIAINARPLP